VPGKISQLFNGFLFFLPRVIFLTATGCVTAATVSRDGTGCADFTDSHCAAEHIFGISRVQLPRQTWLK